MKKMFVVFAIVLGMLIVMFAEYRYIMHHILPYRGEGGTVYLEIFGHTDTYYAEEVVQTEEVAQMEN